MAGIFVSALTIPIPRVIGRILDILGGLAPPMALLPIGASLSPEPDPQISCGRPWGRW